MQDVSCCFPQLLSFGLHYPGHLCHLCLRAIVYSTIVSLVSILSPSSIRSGCRSSASLARDTMTDQSPTLDDVRYQHHLEHRGRANQHIFFIAWTLIAVVVISSSSGRVVNWWNRRQ
jgi:hypothetical protein